MAARYLYFAAAGWALLVSELLVLIRRRAVLAAVVCGIAIAFAMVLQLNLRPWRVAGDVVVSMQRGVRNGKSAQAALEQWQAQHPVHMIIVNGIPREYQGVSIFNNGYPEFVEIEASSAAQP